MPFHPPIWSLTPEEVYAVSHSSPQGLSEEEARDRRRQNGLNELPEPVQRPLILRFTDQLTHFMALLLWVAGVLAFVSGTAELGWAIWAVIWINAVFSFWQEFQAEKALAALKQVLPAQVKVYRSGLLQTIPARELVPGDLIQLEEGDRISADARLIDTQTLYMDMSVLTGESMPVPRYATPVPDEKIQASDASNLVFAGATVASGRGLAVVYAIGTHTEFGQVAHLTASIHREPSTLEIQITKVVHIITLIALSMGVLVFLLTKLFVGMSLKESFIFAIGIIVAFVPEGLLPTVSLALAIGVQQMAKKNALVRRLSAVETLSATTVICTDKTGTLTKNEMTVRYLWIPRHTGAGEVEVTGAGYDPGTGTVKIEDARSAEQVRQLVAGLALCCNAQVRHLSGSSQWQAVGDPTEVALVVLGRKAFRDWESLVPQMPRLREVPFDSKRRRMTVLVDTTQAALPLRLPPQTAQLELAILPQSNPDRGVVVTKGAPIDVLDDCDSLLREGQIETLTPELRSQIEEANDRLASRGYRVLGLGIREGGSELESCTDEDLEAHLTFIGLVAMMDPPRPEVAEAIVQCYQAGIQVTMITGDYGLTAEAIARRIGLVNGRTRIITGEQLNHLSNAQLNQILHRWKDGLVFARVMPEQKLRLVQAYKSLGHIVAVTGDGVNDAPALRAANIGIAMGLNGTDVAREAADIVLVDDNFATIVSAIEQGRSVYQNIRKFMTYILASNVAEFLPFLAMVVFKIPPALVILQILAIDLGTDMVPALALGAEKPEVGIMKQPPRKQTKPLLDRSLLLRAYCFLGLLEGMAGMVGFFLVWLAHGYNLPALQAVTPSLLSHSAEASVLAIYHQSTTLMLAAIVAGQDGNVFACRSERVSIFKLGFFSNPLIWLGIGVEWLIILSVIYASPFQRIFSTAPLQSIHWFGLLFCPILVLGADELCKRIVYSRR